MKDLNNLSTEELLQELKKLMVEEAMSLEERIFEIKPKPVNNPDLTSLTKICVDYVNDRLKSEYIDDDSEHYLYLIRCNLIFEEAIMTIMGKDVFDRFRQIDKLKKENK